MLLLIISLAAIASNLVIGLFIFNRNRNSATNRLFFIMNVTIALWSVANYFSLYPGLDISQIVWVRLVLFCAIALTFLYLLLIHTFPSDQIIMKRKLLKPLLIFTIATMVATLSPYIFSDLTETKNGAQPVIGPLIPLFAGTVTAFILIGTGILIKKHARAKGKLKLQLKYLLYGATVMFALILATVLFPSIFFNNSTLAPYASLYALIFDAATAYAIVRHHLFNIQAIVARSVAYSLLVSIVLIIYTLAIFGLSQIMHQGGVGFYQVTVYAILAMFVAATFQPLKKWLENKTDQVFYQTRYSTSAFLSRLTKIIASTLDLEKLAQLVLTDMLRTMHISKGTIIIENSQGDYQILAQVNMETNQEVFADIRQVCNLGRIVDIEQEENKTIAGLMRRDNIAIILPLQTEHQLKGAVLLGDKQSGDLYTKQDIQVLEILGPELAVAIENAHSYQQVQEFNKTLQENIDKATQQLKSANEQLSRKNHQLEQLDKLKDEFISVTSHELRTPLTAIRGYLWMVMNNRKDASTKLYLDRAYISSERLIALVNDTLDISRIESGRVQLNPEPTKLPALAKLVAQELEPRAVERHQQLIVKQDSHLPAVDCDADKIHQVLTNLVGNALKFTPEKGKITVHFYTDKHMVVAAVSDTGPGVSPADQKKLFQKFSRLESTIGVPGTGLGLYLCQQIIELSKGKIWMDSQVGQGSTFFFSLPISKQQPSILPVPRQSFNKVA